MVAESLNMNVMHLITILVGTDRKQLQVFAPA